MTGNRRLAVWTAIGLGLAALVGALLAGRDRLLFHWKLEQAISGQKLPSHEPNGARAPGDMWREKATPERWLRDRWSAVGPLLIAETRRGSRERRVHVLGLLAFLQMDLGERLDLAVLWRAMVEPARLESLRQERIEVVVLTHLGDLHKAIAAALYVRREGPRATACQLRSEPSGERVVAQVWDVEGEEAERLSGLIGSVAALEELGDLKRWASPGPLSAQIYAVSHGRLSAQPLHDLPQSRIPWVNEYIVRLFELASEPSRHSPRTPRPGDVPPLVLEAMESMLGPAQK